MSSVTVGGVAATLVGKVSGSGRGYPVSGLFVVDAGSGSSLSASTTANITVNYANTMGRSTLDVYHITGASLTPNDTKTSVGSSPASVQLNIPADGSAIAVNSGLVSSAGALTSWTNLTE